MTQVPMDDARLKALFKTALVEVLEERKDLLRDVIALSELVDLPGADPRALTAMVNVQYDALLASIDLMKSHVEMPTVPRPRR